MISILKKELNSFLSSLSGYMVVLVFLILNGLFLWVFPGSFNPFHSGHKEMSKLAENKTGLGLVYEICIQKQARNSTCKITSYCLINLSQ